MHHKILLLIAVFAGPWLSARAEKITYEKHIRPLFQDSCFKCHNPDKAKGGLDLTTMNAILAGGGSGAVVVPGDPDASFLYLVMTHAEEPFMPPKASKRPDAELELVKQWIAGGLLANDASVAAVPRRTGVSLALADIESGRPDGPPPMPGDLALEPVNVPPRADAIVALAANPWSPVVAVGSENQVLLHHPDTRELLGVLPFPEGAIYDLTFSKNGEFLLVAGGQPAREGKAVLFNVRNGRRLLDVGEDYDAILAADLSADQRFIATGGTDKFIRIFDTATGEKRHQIKKHTEWVTAVAYSPDGVLLATGDRNGNLHIWEAGNAQEFYTLKGHDEQITELAWRRDSNILASASEDGSIRLWNMHDGRQVKSGKSHGEGVLAIDYFPDGKLLTCGRDRVARVWNGEGKQQKAVKFDALTLQVCAGTDNKTIVVGDFNGALHVADVSGKKTGTLESTPPRIADRLARAREALKGITPEFQAREKLFGDRDTALKQADTALADRRNTLKQARAGLTAAEKALKELEGLIARNNGTMTEANKQVAAAKKEVAERQKAIDEAHGKKEGLGKEVSALAQQSEATPDAAPAEALAAKKKQLAEAEKQLEALSKARQEAGKRLQEAENMLGASRDTLKQTRQRADEQRQQTEHLRPEVQKAEAAVNEAEARRAQAKTDRDTAEKALNEARPWLAALKADVRKWEAAEFNLSVHAARRDLHEKEAALQARETEITRAEKARDAARNAVHEQKNKVDALQKKYETMKGTSGA